MMGKPTQPNDGSLQRVAHPLPSLHLSLRSLRFRPARIATWSRGRNRETDRPG